VWDRRRTDRSPFSSRDSSLIRASAEYATNTARQ
jgi:hypothetical protein